MDTQAEPEITGVDEYGHIIVDAYSGEAMNPKFRQAWRNFCQARVCLEDVTWDIKESGLDIQDADDLNNIIGYDYPFVWRELTPEEHAWAEAAYAAEPQP